MPDLEWEATAVADLLAIVEYTSKKNPDVARSLRNEMVLRPNYWLWIQQRSATWPLDAP